MSGREAVDAARATTHAVIRLEAERDKLLALLVRAKYYVWLARETHRGGALLAAISEVLEGAPVAKDADHFPNVEHAGSNPAGGSNAGAGENDAATVPADAAVEGATDKPGGGHQAATPAPVSEFNEQAADLVWGEGGRHPLPGSEEALMKIAALQEAAPVSEAAPHVNAPAIEIPERMEPFAHPVEHAEGLPDSNRPDWLDRNGAIAVRLADLQRLAEIAVESGYQLASDLVEYEHSTFANSAKRAAVRAVAAWRAQRGGK